MHVRALERHRHEHDYHLDSVQGEKRTLYVVILTAVMMVVEIAAGYLFGSMALLADGWHMGTHVAALGISLFAYRYARRHSDNPVFSFGTGKVSSLGGFASAVALAVVALLMGVESFHRLLFPEIISYDEAILVAVIGLVVNLVSAWVLQGGYRLHHQDYNLRAAYLHVLADALTSLLAIGALLCGRVLGWVWVDALMGIVGAIIISRWSIGLLREAGGILLDGVPDEAVAAKVRRLIETDADNRISDLHLWQVGPNRFAAIISLVTHRPQEPDHYKGLLAEIDELAHVTVEANPCRDEGCRNP